MFAEITLNANPRLPDEDSTRAEPFFKMPSFGGDGLLPVINTIPKERISVDERRTFRDVFIDVVSKWPQPISPKTEGRVTVVEAPK